MRDVQVNLLDTPKAPKSKEKSAHVRTLGNAARAVLATLACSVIVASLVLFRMSVTGQASSEEILNNLPIIGQIRTFMNVATRETAEEVDGRTNILILGVGGPGHEGPQLSDTMLLASLDKENARASVVSIPRDLIVTIPEKGIRKINHANAYGEEKYPGEGPRLAVETLEPIIKRKIHYYVRVDFRAFEEIIDAIGGIDVKVDRAFTDEQYPTNDYGFQTISFTAGQQHMNGSTALQFIRSRHGNNGEGSDFARSARQQKVINAVREKVLSRSTLTSPSKITSIINTLKWRVSTNLTVMDIVALAAEAKEIKRENIYYHVINDAPENLLYAKTTQDVGFGLYPKTNDWSELQSLFKEPFTKTPPTTAVAPAHKPFVEVQNGTAIPGLAGSVAERLKRNGYDIAKVTNAAERGLEKTVIMDFTKGVLTQERDQLAKLLNADIREPLADWSFTKSLEHDTEKPLDFLVIVGESSAQQSALR